MSTIEKAARVLAARQPSEGESEPRIDTPAGGEAQQPQLSATGHTAERGASQGERLAVTALGSELLLSPEGGRSRLAEEFRMIKRPLLVNAFDRQSAGRAYPNLLMVTSALKGEGKTFTSLNLAISITMELDSTVLLVDADVARPGLSTLLGIADRRGLLDRLLDEQADLGQFLIKTDIPKLTVLPAGQRHKRSTELLASGAMRRLLVEVATRYPDRIVLFDSPPLLETTEASVLAAQMGQVVIVVAADATSQDVVQEALSQFQKGDCIYIVLNKRTDSLVAGRYGYGYGYGYGYRCGYGSDVDPERGKAAR